MRKKMHRYVYLFLLCVIAANHRNSSTARPPTLCCF